MLVVVVLLAAVFAVVNGVHDAGNAIAVPIVTGAMRPAVRSGYCRRLSRGRRSRSGHRRGGHHRGHRHRSS